MHVAAVLITGGSGYLGRFLARHYASSGCQVGLTYFSNAPENLPKNVEAFKVNFATGEGLDACLAALSAGGRQLVAVINCAAISQPAACERDPAAAEAVNVPTQLLDALDRWWQSHKEAAEAATAAAGPQQQQHEHGSSVIKKLLTRISLGTRVARSRSGSLSRQSSGGLAHSDDGGGGVGGGGDGSGGAGSRASSDAGGNQPPLFVQLSTDQVYDGSRAWWREDDEARPINAYGRTKLAGEAAVAARWPNHAILRCSLIYGPAPPFGPIDRPLFLQFVDQRLSQGAPTEFFTDEWRCPIRVRDIVRVIQTLISRQGELQHRLFNMGGPDRLSRADMALAVAEAHGYDPALVVPAPAPPAARRGVPSPADISMDCARLRAELHLELTPFRTALEHIFKDHDHQ